ncbi:FtsK/SpoIIIE domain-containing protein, partial [Streptococcus suis]
GIISSILMKAGPDQVKFMMIDPKMVELSVYNDIPHLLIPVVTNPRKAARALQKVVDEMEKRYELFSQIGVRNLEGYNAKVEEFNSRSE